MHRRSGLRYIPSRSWRYGQNWQGFPWTILQQLAIGTTHVAMFCTLVSAARLRFWFTSRDEWSVEWWSNKDRYWRCLDIECQFTLKWIHLLQCSLLGGQPRGILAQMHDWVRRHIYLIQKIMNESWFTLTILIFWPLAVWLNVHTFQCWHSSGEPTVVRKLTFTSGITTQTRNKIKWLCSYC